MAYEDFTAGALVTRYDDILPRRRAHPVCRLQQACCAMRTRSTWASSPPARCSSAAASPPPTCSRWWLATWPRPVSTPTTCRATSACTPACRPPRRRCWPRICGTGFETILQAANQIAWAAPRWCWRSAPNPCRATRWRPTPTAPASGWAGSSSGLPGEAFTDPATRQGGQHRRERGGEVRHHPRGRRRLRRPDLRPRQRRVGRRLLPTKWRR